MSASDAFTTLTTTALPMSASVAGAPSRVFSVSVLPSTFSMVPRSRTVCCCASADVVAYAATKAAAASAYAVILFIVFLPKNVPHAAPEGAACAIPRMSLPVRRRAASHRRGDAIAANRDRRGLERAVFLLVGAGDEDLGAGLELVLAAGDVGHDHGLGHDHDLLFPVLVLERDLVTMDALHHGRHGGVGHGAVGLQIPWPEAFAGAAHRLGKDVNLDRLLAAVGLRHA